MVLTRAAAARLAAAASEGSPAQDAPSKEQPRASTKGCRSKPPADAPKQQIMQDAPVQEDPLEAEMRRFQAELDAIDSGSEEKGPSGCAESKSRGRVSKGLQASSTDQQKEEKLAAGAGIGLSGGDSVIVLSAGPELYSKPSQSVQEATSSEPKDAVLMGAVLKAEGGKSAKAKEAPLVPTTRLALSRSERAARAKVLKEALVNVDEKQSEWQEFAGRKALLKSGRENDSHSSKVATLEPSSDRKGEGWVFGKKVAFSFKPKSSSPAKKGSKTLGKSQAQSPASPISQNACGPAGSTSDHSGESPSQAVEQTPLPAPRPALALNTPAVKAQAGSGNPVLDLRFLFPKATPPEPGSPFSSTGCAAHPINMSSGEGRASESFSSSEPAEEESDGVGGASEEATSEDAFETTECPTPGPNLGGFASPFSVESASPALKEILRAAHSFAAERGASSPSPSPLNPNPNPDFGTGRARARRESYSDVFASPALVNIFKGARQTAVQKAGPEKAQTELEKLTQAAKEYAASRAQLAVEKSPLGVLCQKESQLALSFAEKLQLADPVEVLDDTGSNAAKWGERQAYFGQSADNMGRDGFHGKEMQAVRTFDGRTVELRSGGVLDNWALPAVGQGSDQSTENVVWDGLPDGASHAVRSFDGRTIEVHSETSALTNHAPPPVAPVPSSVKERTATLHVVVDTNCYLSASDMPAVRRIYDAAQSVAAREQRFEWQGASGVVIVVPNAVIRELDGLKLNPNTTGMARAALRFLSMGCKTQPRSIQLAGPEKVVQVEPIKNGPPEFSGADDAILGCCLYMDRNEGEAILLTNDVALQLKAMMYGLEATSAAEFLAQRLVQLEQPTSNWAAQMRQVVAMREAVARAPPYGQRVAAC